MDQQGVLIIRKLLYEEFPNQIADYKDNINRSKIKKLKKLNIQTIYIFTTEPVDENSFLSVINDYKNNGFDVKLKHLDKLDNSDFNSIINILTDIYASFKKGGCLMVSYGKTFALPIICCFYISRQKKAEDALDNIKNLTNKAIDDDEELSFIYNFQHYFEQNGIDFENILSGQIEDTTLQKISPIENNNTLEPFFETPADEQKLEQKPFFEEPAEEQKSEQKPFFEEPADEHKSEQKPFFEAPADEQKSEQKPFFEKTLPERPINVRPEKNETIDIIVEENIPGPVDKKYDNDEIELSPIDISTINENDDIHIKEIGDAAIENKITPLTDNDLAEYSEIQEQIEKPIEKPEPISDMNFSEDGLETIELGNDSDSTGKLSINRDDAISKLSEIEIRQKAEEINKFEIESTQNDRPEKKVIIQEIPEKPVEKEKKSKKEEKKEAKIAKKEAKLKTKEEKKQAKAEKKQAKLDKKNKKDKNENVVIDEVQEETDLNEVKVEEKHVELDKPLSKADLKKAKKDNKKYDKEIGKVELGHFYSSIRFKMISIISLIIIFSLSGMIFFATETFKEDIQVNVQENNLKISEVIAQKVEAEIEKIKVLAGAMLQNVTMDANEDILFAGIATQKDNNIIITKSSYNTYLINKTKTDENTLNKIHSIYKKDLIKTFERDTVVQNISRELKFPAIALSFPFTQARSGEINSIRLIYIKLDTILKTFRPKGIIRSFLVNYKGDIIAHHDNSVVLTGGSYIKLPIVDSMLKSTLNNGQQRYTHDDNKIHLGSFKKIEIGGGGIIAHVSEEKALAEVYAIQRRNFYIMVAVVASAILIVFFFGKTLTTPILRLVGATKQISEGEFDIKIRPTTRDEIGVLTSTFIEMGKGLEEREKIKSAFGKFVNEEIANAALRDELKLGGERKTIAIFFSDIRSFTAISENLEPEEVVEFLNQYMTIMVKCIEETNGIVDKFIGDAIMAVWGTPISKGNDTENAINCSILMRERLIDFNKDRGTDKKPLINIGCGINTGPALAGQIGSEDRMEYTVIGDSVNLASRIEALNKPFGTDILISEDSYQKVKDTFVVEKMQPIRVKGKVEPQNVYAVLGRKDQPNGINSVEELRDYLGIKMKTPVDKNKVVDPNEGEVKYEILEE